MKATIANDTTKKPHNNMLQNFEEIKLSLTPYPSVRKAYKKLNFHLNLNLPYIESQQKLILLNRRKNNPPDDFLNRKYIYQTLKVT